MITSNFDIGRARHRIRFQRKSVIKNAVGEEIVTWVDVITNTSDNSVWAYIKPLSGRELVNAQSIYAEVTHQIVIRWQAIFADPQSVAMMRVVYAGRNYNIGSAIDVDMAHKWVEISVQEGLVDG